MKYMIAGIVTVILGCGAVAALYFVFQGNLAAEHAAGQKLSDELASRGFPKASQNMTIDEAALRKQLALLAEVSDSEKAYVTVIGQVARLLPHGAWLSGISFNRKTVAISGEAINDGAIQELLGGIRDADLFSSVQLKSAFVRHEKTGSIFQFQIDGKMKGASHASK